jgi:predicted RNA-binding Zn-ribbon protein involved in translation (DUF1610 family)
MSMVSNLRELEENGVEAVLKSQEVKHKCPECGDIISVHDRKCYACGFVKPRLKKLQQE